MNKRQRIGLLLLMTAFAILPVINSKDIWEVTWVVFIFAIPAFMFVLD